MCSWAFFHKGPKSLTQEAMTMMFRLHWRRQDYIDNRVTEHPSMRASQGMWKQPKRGKCFVVTKARGWSHLSPVISDMAYSIWVLSCFDLAFVLYFLNIPWFLLLHWQCIVCTIVCWTFLGSLELPYPSEKCSSKKGSSVQHNKVVSILQILREWPRVIYFRHIVAQHNLNKNIPGDN